MISRRHSIRRPFSYFLYCCWQWLLLAAVLPKVAAEESACTLTSDGNPHVRFALPRWLRRGVCVRKTGPRCYTTLATVLKNMNEIRKAEYGAASSVLSLLPTIGALLGTPTNEIWRLMTIVPFGGGLVMSMSFGGAIMPVRIEEYEHVTTGRTAVIGSIISLRRHPAALKEDSTEGKLKQLVEKVRNRIEQVKNARICKKSLATGLTGLACLFMGSQAAMVVLELGSVLPWWCRNYAWVHGWYLLVTVSAAFENWLQLPFVAQYKMYVSHVPYNIAVSGGESITNCFRTSEAEENVAIALHQLSTLRSATVTIEGSQQFTRSRNATFVLVSVVGSISRLRAFLRLMSKSISIAIFVAGTAIFASATLLSLVLAASALTMILAAGVFGRAIAGWIVSKVSESEPMIHIIADNPKEAYRAVTEILTLRPTDGGHFQVEMDGHVSINERRVAHRTPLYVNLLGVLAEPFDLRKIHKDVPIMAPLLKTPSADSSTTLFSPYKSSVRTFTFESESSE